MSETRTTILTVDDNEALRYSLVRTLRDAGYEVLEAKSGNEALELASTLPDLITLDVNLPDIDGFKVCQTLKSNPATNHIPVLHVSSTFVEPEYRAQGLKGGADGYLAEPIDRAELLATVGALLRLKQAERDARRHAELVEIAHQEIRALNIGLELRVKERTTELERKNEEIQQLNGRLMQLQDEERRRLARELHDSTGQMLAALNINLTLLKSMTANSDPKMAEIVHASGAVTEELTRQIRTMSYLLHPPLLDEVGLESALRWYVEGFSQRSNIAVNIQASDNFGRLPSDLEIALFRVVQESLTNVHKHSGSRVATVHIARDTTQVVLEVRDGGQTMHVGKKSFAPGVGILGMRERLRQLGGRLEIHSDEVGTLIRALVPLSENLQANIA
jgi:signal transduction histidine kinase